MKNFLIMLYYNIIRFLKDIPLNIKTFIQRGKRGYADSDTWGFCDYLTNVILGGLKHLRKYKHGYPSTLNPKTGKYDYDEKRWDNILGKMIYTFETNKKTCDNYPKKDWFYTPTKEWETKKDIREKLKDIMKIMTKEECLAYEEGWKLFAKYFHSLWD